MKLASIVLGRKNVAQPFFRGHATFFQPETIVASFVHRNDHANLIKA